jgi:polysaccharide export outer membrane protein
MQPAHGFNRAILTCDISAAPLHERPSRLNHRHVAAALVTLAWVAYGADALPQSEPVGAKAAPASRAPLQATYNAYILGPGDSLQIELLNIPMLSGTFSIGPDGTPYLPRLRALFVKGLTVEELRNFLTELFQAYVKNDQLFVKLLGYPAVRVHVGGKLSKSDYYLLSGSQRLDDQIPIREGSSPPDTRRQTTSLQDFAAARVRLSRTAPDDITTLQGGSAQPLRWPTLFDALGATQGVTPNSNLGEALVVRKQPLSAGGDKMQAQVDFLRLVTNGDESVNIRLFDGDAINVSLSPQVLREQLLADSRTNLSPDYVEVFVSGLVKEPGSQSLPQGATLNQAIASAGCSHRYAAKE